MTKYNQSSVGRFSVCAIAIAMTTSVFGDGYRNPPPTGVGVAKAGVHLVFVDDASAISYNPANLSFQTNKSFVNGAAIAQSQSTYTPVPGLSFESDDPWQPLPSVYFSTPVGENGTAVGLGITTPYGQGLAWSASEFEALVAPFPSAPVPYEAMMGLINFNPTVSTMLGEKVALGVGLNIMYSFVELKALLAGPGGPPPVSSAKGEGDGWAFGSNIGFTWLPTERQRASFTYRSKVDIDYKGDFSIDGSAAGSFSTTINLPNIIGLGYGFQVTENIQIEAMLEWLEWSSNKTQPLNAGVLGSSPQPNNWKDTVTAGIAGSWIISEAFTAHFGYSFIETPIPDSTITPLLPDADRHVLGIGLGYTTGAHTFDISYAFSIYDDRTSPPGALAPGTYEIDSNLVGMTYSLAF